MAKAEQPGGAFLKDGKHVIYASTHLGADIMSSGS